MCVVRVLRRHLLLINAIAVVLDAMFFGASTWVFVEVASVLAGGVEWYFLVMSFAPPVCIPLYNVLERLVRRDCVRKAARENAVAHAHGRAQHAMAAAFWNSFGINALTFWAPFFIEALEPAPRTDPALVWQRLLRVPSALTFCIVYLGTVVWNFVMMRVYLSLARDSLRVLVDEDESKPAAEPVAPTRDPRFAIELADVRETAHRTNAAGNGWVDVRGGIIP